MRINLPATQKDNGNAWGEDEFICSKTDCNGIIIYANKLLCDISGYSERELVGQPHNIMRHPDMPCVAFAWCWEALNAKRNWRGIVKNRCKNGDHYWVDANISPQINADGIVLGYFSARRRPTREQIDEADALYAELRRAEGDLESRGKLTRQAIMDLYRNSPLYHMTGI